MCVCHSGGHRPDVPARLPEQTLCSPRSGSERPAGSLLHAHTGEKHLRSIKYQRRTFWASLVTADLFVDETLFDIVLLPYSKNLFCVGLFYLCPFGVFLLFPPTVQRHEVDLKLRQNCLSKSLEPTNMFRSNNFVAECCQNKFGFSATSYTSFVSRQVVDSLNVNRNKRLQLVNVEPVPLLVLLNSKRETGRSSVRVFVRPVLSWTPRTKS